MPVAFIAGIVVSVIILLAGVFILNTIAIKMILFLNVATILGKLLYAKSGHSSSQIIPLGLPLYPLQPGIFPPQCYPQCSPQLLNNQYLPPYQLNNRKSFTTLSQQPSSNESPDLANMEMELMELIAMMKNDLKSKNVEESLMSTEEPPMTDITDNISREGQSAEEINYMVENNRQHFRPPMMIDTVLRPPRL